MGSHNKEHRPITEEMLEHYLLGAYDAGLSSMIEEAVASGCTFTGSPGDL